MELPLQSKRVTLHGGDRSDTALYSYQQVTDDYKKAHKQRYEHFLHDGE